MPDAAKASDFPLPAKDLLLRIGPMGSDPAEAYERTGRESRDVIEATLPPDWSWDGRRALDFGCGSGRIIRHFADVAGEAEFYGCDIDEPSVRWLQANLSPPFTFFEATPEPDLDQPDGFFDLIYAFSVYTHLTDNWAEWMLEHHRILKPGGYLFVTFLGPGMMEPLIGEEWDEDRIGMNSLFHGHPWSLGGPISFNSPWWIRAHWGRAFDVVALDPEMPAGSWVQQGTVLLRRKDVALGPDDLTRLEADEPRELTALRHQVTQLAAESEGLRREKGALEAQLAKLATTNEGALQQARELDALRSSRSWKLTAPLREARARLRPRP